MQLNTLHDWNMTPAEAIALQKQLASRVIDDRPLDLAAIRMIAGVDVSVKNEISQAAVVVYRFPELEIIETVRAQLPTVFPYIPGLLSFREGPVLVQAFDKLQNVPDVFIFDGMGRLHPRRIGIASHMGLWLAIPTVGCGKTPFIGTYTDPAAERGAHTPIVHKDEVIGATLRTRATAKPVYISVGHLATLDTALDLIMRCTGKYRLPEPIRGAHHAAGEYAAGQKTAGQEADIED